MLTQSPKIIVDDVFSMSAFQHVHEIKGICEPLKYLDIHFFCYYEQYPDNTLLFFINMPEVSEAWEEKNTLHYLQYPFFYKMTDIPGWHLWEPFLSNPLFPDLSQLLGSFDFVMGASFVEWSGTTKKVYHFSSRSSDVFFHHLFNTSGLLRKFIRYFKPRVQPIVSKSNCYRLPEEVIRYFQNEQLSHEVLKSIQEKEQQFLAAVGDAVDELVLFGDEYKLTKRERQCLQEVMRGHASKRIAYELNLSTRTVEQHLQSIRKKTHCRTKIDLILKIQSLGLF